MKILFILEYYHPHIGGVETLFKSLAEKLVQEGHEITVLTNKFDKSLPRDEVTNGVHIRRLPFQNRYAFTFLAVFQAVRFARHHDFIHTTSYNAAISAYIAGKWSGKKMIITFHEVWGELWKELPWMSGFSKWLHALFERFILKMKFDRFIAVSDFTQSALVNHGVDSAKVRRIYNGIQYDEFLKPQNLISYPQKTFLFYGRAGVSKGVDVLLDAIEILKQEGKSVHFILVLPPPSDPNVQIILKRIEELKIQSFIEVKSSLPFDVLKQTIASVDGVIIPSYSEGFCFAAAETIALGTPVISSARGALKEVIGGKYLEFSDLNPHSLAEQIIKGAQGEWDEKQVIKFDLKDSVDQYIRLYEEISSEA